MARKDAFADPFDPEAALDELERTDASTAAFARERGAAAWRLYEGLRRRRKRRLAERAVGSGQAFVPVQLATRPSSGGVVAVELPGGRALCVPKSYGESARLRLARALEPC